MLLVLQKFCLSPGPATRQLSLQCHPNQQSISGSKLILNAAKRTISTFKSIQEEINDANTRYDNILSVRETTDRGWGVYVTRSKPFKAGEKVLTSASLEESEIRHAHTIQKDWNKHVIMDLPARFVNHSCDPNMGVRDNKTGAYDFIAKRNIAVGEELLWDYETTEYEISAFETCLCGSWNCKKHLGGFKLSGDKIKESHGEYYADYLKERESSPEESLSS